MGAYLLCFLVLFAVGDAKKNLPSYIKPCQRNSNISECITRNLEAARPFLAKGIPRLSIPPLDPLVIPSASFVLDNFTLSMIDVQFYEIHLLQLRDIKLDLEDGVFNAKIFFPRFNASAEYVMEGSLFGIELDGENTAYGHGDDFLFEVKLKGTQKRVGDKTYMDFKKTHFDILSFVNVVAQFDNAIRGNPELSKAANEIINRNMDTFLHLLTPSFDKMIGGVFAEAVRNNFLKFPLEQLFPIG